MSEPNEGFLARWSRRKREAPEAVPESGAAPAKPDAAATPGDSETAQRQGEAATPAFDLSKLPALESITAGTDVRAFLTAGVPEQLKRAALRRAWTADPAIRDFVGLAENAWDFTTPDSMPGFGPMLPTDDIARMVAQINGQRDPAVPEAEADSGAALSESAHELAAGANTPAQPTGLSTISNRIDDRPNPRVAAISPDGISGGEPKTPDIAAQNEPASESAPLERGHGSAVPR